MFNFGPSKTCASYTYIIRLCINITRNLLIFFFSRLGVNDDGGWLSREKFAIVALRVPKLNDNIRELPMPMYSYVLPYESPRSGQMRGTRPNGEGNEKNNFSKHFSRPKSPKYTSVEAHFFA